MKTLWKVFKKGRTSNNGDIKWKLNKWNHHEGDLILCHSGFHASERIIDAMQYTACEEIVLVEIGDDFIKGNDKYVCRDMRVIKSYKWGKKDSVALAIFAAELVIDIFEKEHPNDKRPREAIEAAKKVLKSDTKKNRAAAGDAARYAVSAAASDAAWGVAWAAARAARAARAAASDAAWGVAWAAAWVARVAASAAGDAAEAAIYDKCDKFIQERIGAL